MSQEYGAGGYVDPTEDMDPEEYALLCEYVQYLNDNNGYDDEDYLSELLQRRGQTRNRTKSRAPPPQRAPPPLYPAEEDEEDDEEDDESEEEG